MRVGLDVLFLVPGEVGGSEIYARELIGALGKAKPDNEYLVYCAREAADSLRDEDWPANIKLRVLPINARSKPQRVLYEMLALPVVARRDRVDLLHSLGQTTPLWSRPARVVSVLDLIFHHHPETFPGPARRGLEVLVPAGARRARRVTAISQATKNDLVATYGIDADKIDVVLLGAGFSEPARALGRDELAAGLGLPPGEFALCVASGHAHKNIPRLLEAFAQLPQRRLVLVGHAGLDQERLVAQAIELGIDDRVVFTGWIDSDVLEGLYREAALFVYPTLLEGFGLPVLEAMHRGVPVVCSNSSSLPEVAGEAARMVDPTDTAAIAAAIEEVFSDPLLRSDLIERGRDQARKFTWERCANGTLEVYARALGPS